MSLSFNRLISAYVFKFIVRIKVFFFFCRNRPALLEDKDDVVVKTKVVTSSKCKTGDLGTGDLVETSAPHNKSTALKCTAFKYTNRLIWDTALLPCMMLYVAFWVNSCAELCFILCGLCSPQVADLNCLASKTLFVVHLFMSISAVISPRPCGHQKITPLPNKRIALPMISYAVVVSLLQCFHLAYSCMIKVDTGAIWSLWNAGYEIRSSSPVPKRGNGHIFCERC